MDFTMDRHRAEHIRDKAASGGNLIGTAWEGSRHGLRRTSMITATGDRFIDGPGRHEHPRPGNRVV
jgi:hypothetical protein